MLGISVVSDEDPHERVQHLLRVRLRVSCRSVSARSMGRGRGSKCVCREYASPDQQRKPMQTSCRDESDTLGARNYLPLQDEDRTGEPRKAEQPVKYSQIMLLLVTSVIQTFGETVDCCDM